MEGGTGHRTELTCLVHAEPRADVTWYKNAMLLDLGTREEGESWEMDDLLKYFFFVSVFFLCHLTGFTRANPGALLKARYRCLLLNFVLKWCFIEMYFFLSLSTFQIFERTGFPLVCRYSVSRDGRRHHLTVKQVNIGILGKRKKLLI